MRREAFRPRHEKGADNGRTVQEAEDRTTEGHAAQSDEQDPAVLAERRRKEAEMRARGGRDSTIMSDALMGATGKLGA